MHKWFQTYDPNVVQCERCCYLRAVSGVVSAYYNSGNGRYDLFDFATTPDTGYVYSPMSRSFGHAKDIRSSWAYNHQQCYPVLNHRLYARA